jgi:protein phosphatase
MAIVTGEISFLSNVGDSRAYLINEREITKVTTDHSLVERLVATGKISPQEARTHPQRNMIYRTIGDKSRVETDVFTQRLQVGDYLLLCSDGLNGMITDRQIFDIVRTSISPQDACNRLIEAANEAGGEDNVTVVAAQAIAG